MTPQLPRLPISNQRQLDLATDDLILSVSTRRKNIAKAIAQRAVSHAALVTLISIPIVSVVNVDDVQAQTATYYHPSLSGRIKANGQPYNPNRLTAASNNYRLGTRVRVTNRRNGKSVVVVITDRCGNCSIDLSRAAFQRIAPLKQGRVPVRITRL
jgi:rare lipoprotein A (peptidoglycan hydrolase)